MSLEQLMKISPKPKRGCAFALGLLGSLAAVVALGTHAAWSVVS